MTKAVKKKALFRVLETRGWKRNRYGMISVLKENSNRLRVKFDKDSVVVDLKSPNDEGKLVWKDLSRCGLNSIKVNEESGAISGLKDVVL